MSDQAHVSRRNVLLGAATAAIAASAVSAAEQPAGLIAKPQPTENVVKNGRINHSVCHWCYNSIKLPEFAPIAKKMGLKAIDLIQPKDFPVLKEHGLIGSMTSHPVINIEVGLNRKENHEKMLPALREAIEATAAEGWSNVICFSGNRHLKKKSKDAPLEGKISDEEGIKVCAEALKQVMALAEQKKVTVCMELLNSRVNHPDYMCDKSAWGIELCKAVGSERFKLLYDIYHMQIMEGDIIRTIKRDHQYFGHYHTGGNPGRNEIDETQELNYPAIMRAILDIKYTGFVAQEFIPARANKIASLAQGVQICDV
ncbi:MAG TPA: TIM barrel protein [Tepidisphaeraceae bacterium]|nr:TIM barrel protein [Tepidisphaeraceae bacterium]